jgi:plastocyanin
MLTRRAIAALASSFALTLVLTAQVSAAAPHRNVQMLDACDGPSFNAAIGPGTCARPEGVAFPDFINQLVTMGRAPAWRFAPARVTLASGGTVEAYNRGGEFHTFTEVAAFGGGCVPEINGLLGLSAVPECADPTVLATTGAAPGGHVETAQLATGMHRFECLIHPWMRTTVDVR